MANASNNDIKNIIRYANISAENLAEVTASFSAAIVEMQANKGGDLISGSTNGSTFTKNPAMTVSQYATMLRMALEHIDAGTLPQNRTIARLV